MAKGTMHQGVSWDDVREWLRDLEREYKVYAHYEMVAPPDALGQSMGLVISLTLVGVSASGRDGFTRTLKASWPTYSQKTMPGLCLYLVHAARESLLSDPPTHRKQVKALVYPKS